jgi:hypothetical protein
LENASGFLGQVDQSRIDRLGGGNQLSRTKRNLSHEFREAAAAGRPLALGAVDPSPELALRLPDGHVGTGEAPRHDVGLGSTPDRTAGLGDSDTMAAGMSAGILASNRAPISNPAST